MEKKKCAAIAAVMHYLEFEKARSSDVSEESFPKPSQASSLTREAGPWALTGRQTQMQMRVMSQMKAFHLKH